MITTNRYIVLVGESYYPAGWEDFAGSADTIEDARKLAGQMVRITKNEDWFVEAHPDCDRFEIDG